MQASSDEIAIVCLWFALSHEPVELFCNLDTDCTQFAMKLQISLRISVRISNTFGAQVQIRCYLTGNAPFQHFFF